MEKRVKDLEENAALLKKKSDLLENILEKRDREKAEFLHIIEEKEKQIHELKLNGNGICENGCHRYNKSMDDVVKAGFKHKDAALALKEVAENLKQKIHKLKAENLRLFEEKKQHEDDANDGYEMLQNVRERERMLNIKLQEHKVHILNQDKQIQTFCDEKALVESFKDSIERKKKVSDKIIRDLQLNNENLMKKAEDHTKVVELNENVYQRKVNSLVEKLARIASSLIKRMF